MLQDQKSAKERIGNKGEKLELKTKREECKTKEAYNCEAEIEMQQEQHNQQIQRSMKMMECLRSPAKKHKQHRED